VVQIHPPNGDYVGQVCEGRYCYEDGVVTLVNSAGVPINDRYGKAYEKNFRP
jgi:hypothetical protein